MSAQGTPLSSQIVWLEERVKNLEAEKIEREERIGQLEAEIAQMHVNSERLLTRLGESNMRLNVCGTAARGLFRSLDEVPLRYRTDDFYDVWQMRLESNRWYNENAELRRKVAATVPPLAWSVVGENFEPVPAAREKTLVVSGKTTFIAGGVATYAGGVRYWMHTEHHGVKMLATGDKWILMSKIMEVTNGQA